MNYTIDELRESVNSIPQFIFDKEKNIFDIGTRGFYENPFTDVLAYILDSKSEYKRRNLFLKYLLKDSFSQEIVDSFIDQCNTTTQHTTNLGNRIDLILHNKRYLILFENKIFHTLNNPLDDYVEDINSKYPHLEKFFVIMSYKTEHVPPGWNYINIQHTFYKILKNPLVKLNDKWDFFVNDFLLQFSDKNKLKMEQHITEFIEENFSQILDAKDRLDHYIVGLAEQIKSETDIRGYHINNRNWARKEIAIRFYPFPDEDNVTLIFQADGKLNVSLYYYVNFTQYSADIQAYLGPHKFKLWKEGNICCFTLSESLRYKTIQDAMSEVLEQIKNMRTYYADKIPEKVDFTN
ncbi:PD-(D/E)XK nuclease superfamily protein [Chryseobacterium oranimense]|uniref:PD-(D/E)XK nuclease superfamily protein n=1 Tax=Chryseobacterium oranimense TaxID=421058 RepID=A0A1M5KNQ8_9FLAO|nr:PD-(D/E)XK nuclease family protein [Chryseobacterium oranimense]SHG54159.1 PD-(D/E)XK nuclease superfamily protein [Chryseobacterium oranimense]